MIHDSCTHTHIHTQGGDKVRDIADPPPIHTHTHTGGRGMTKDLAKPCRPAAALHVLMHLP